MLQGVNIFLISHPTIVHLKCQIGPELSLSLMHDIELIRGRCDIPNEYVFLVVWIIVVSREREKMVVWSNLRCALRNQQAL